jgi:hypothetical protein
MSWDNRDVLYASVPSYPTLLQPTPRLGSFPLCSPESEQSECLGRRMKRKSKSLTFSLFEFFLIPLILLLPARTDLKRVPRGMSDRELSRPAENCTSLWLEGLAVAAIRLRVTWSIRPLVTYQ